MNRLFILLTSVIIISIGCKKNDVDLDKPPIVAVEFVIPGDSIKLNPYGYAPLSALVNFSSPVEGKTVIIVKGKHGEASDIEHVFDDNGAYHSIPVIGLYGNFANAVDIRLINNNGDTVAKSSITIQTAPLPSNMPEIVPDVHEIGQVEKGINLVSNLSAGVPLVYTPGAPNIPLMVDNYGDIRWLLDYTTHPDLNALFYDNGIKRSRNGNFFFGDWWSNKIYEVDLLGRIINTWNLSGTGFVFHHEVKEKPDGNFLVTLTKKNSGTIEDYIVELDRQTGAVNTVWDLKESLDRERIALADGFYSRSDWMHVNSVMYDSTDNTIIVSGRHQGVVKLSYDNKVKWILSPHRGWGRNGRGEDMKQFLLAPLDATGNKITDAAVLDGSVNHPDFEWSWYQHSTIALPNGNYMFFDNGSVRNYDQSIGRYSRAVEYKIDPANMTIQQKWQYGKERGLETFSLLVSSVQYLPATNHVLFSAGFRVQNDNGVGGKVVEIDYATKQVVSQLSFSASNQLGFHMVERMSAYP
jgi:arylsulfate sulfotransferase